METYRILKVGAEAKIILLEGRKENDKYIFEFEIENKRYKIEYKKQKIILKYRYPKRYRHPIIDKNFRKYRTRIEARILSKLYGKVNIPELVYVDEESGIILMEYIEGNVLSEVLEKLNYKEILFEIGKIVGKIHKEKITHGDLTTANFILSDKLYLIDFGLSFFTSRIEDFAVDIHLFYESLKSKHYKILDSFNDFLEGYKQEFEKANEVLRRFEIVEKRGRYKSIS